MMPFVPVFAVCFVFVACFNQRWFRLNGCGLNGRHEQTQGEGHQEQIEKLFHSGRIEYQDAEFLSNRVACYHHDRVRLGQSGRRIGVSAATRNTALRKADV